MVSNDLYSFDSEICVSLIRKKNSKPFLFVNFYFFSWGGEKESKIICVYRHQIWLCTKIVIILDLNILIGSMEYLL